MMNNTMNAEPPVPWTMMGMVESFVWGVINLTITLIKYALFFAVTMAISVYFK